MVLLPQYVISNIKDAIHGSSLKSVINSQVYLSILSQVEEDIEIGKDSFKIQ
jgi:hypothetical protein